MQMLRRKAIGASIAALAVAAAGVVVYVAVDDSSVGANEGAKPSGKVRTHALRDLTGSAGGAGGKRVLGVPATKTEPFSLLGVTWDQPRTELPGTVQVRTKAAASGQWSGWQDVESHSHDAPDTKEMVRNARRGGTTGLWVGPSNGVEVRVTGQKSAAFPAGLRVDLVDPGTGSITTKGPRAAGEGTGGMRLAAAAEPVEPGQTTEPTPSDSTTAQPDETAPPTPTETPTPSPSSTDTASPSPSPSESSEGSAPPLKTMAVTAPKPTIVSRAGWAADESIVKGPPTYDTSVKAVFVHHTVTGNSYTCAESASLVRSMFIYHVQSNGWDDIGYNFLVDKCGTIFEGRGGGVDRAVHGAHTLGFNTDTAGISVIGTHTSATANPPGVPPSQAAIDSVAKLAAWKLGLTGVDPTAKTTLTSSDSGSKYPKGTQAQFNTISGHRDGFATECPGEQLYAKLGAIRVAAKQVTTPALEATVTGATLAGGRYYTRSTVTLGWTPQESATYEVKVDGAVAAKPDPGANSATVTLTPGTHTVVLHATNSDGTTAESPPFTVVADTTNPVFNPPPYLNLRNSWVNLTDIPVTLGWKATDNGVVKDVRLTSPTAKTFDPSWTTWGTYGKPGVTQTWSMTATDIMGNSTTASIARTASIVHEQSAVRTGTWASSATSYYLGGRGLYSSSKGASASWTFTGRTVGLIFKRATNLGAVYVYVDGVKVATVDTRASTTAYRQLTWSRNFGSSAKHTVKVVVVGTSGRPTVAIDGIVAVR